MVYSCYLTIQALEGLLRTLRRNRLSLPAKLVLVWTKLNLLAAFFAFEQGQFNILELAIFGVISAGSLSWISSGDIQSKRDS